MNRRYPAIIVIGMILLVSGLWIIAASLGRNLLTIKQLWPLVVMALGLAFLLQYPAERYKRSGLVFIGCVLIGVGAALLPFALAIGRFSWETALYYWPVLLIIVAGGFAAVYIAEDARRPSILMPAYVLGGAGMALLPLTIGLYRSLAFLQAMRLWPLVLVLGALAFLIRPDRLTSDQ
jgi:hypothetical protein